MSIKFTLDFNEAQLIQTIGKQISLQLNLVLSSMVTDNTVRSQVSQVLDTQIRNSPEYDALLTDGDLAVVFGIENSSKVVESIIQTLKNSIHITYLPATFTSGLLRAGITVSLMIDDFSDILSLPGTSFESDGGQVPWLSWLLTSGDGTVISDYNVELTTTNSSRTGKAIMVKSARGFRVPPEYSGTFTDNWLTRAIEGMDEVVGNILFVELNRRL